MALEGAFLVFRGLEDRPGLKAFSCIRSSRTIKEAAAAVYRHFLTSLTDTARFAHSVRAHWGIENKVH